MKDSYGRTIDYMRISITDRCNLRCRYCMPEQIPLVSMEELLTYEEIETICLAAAREGICKLKITGGEPLVRRGCAVLVGRLKQIPGIQQVTMTTNGVELERHLPELLAGGLDAVNISLYTQKPEVYRALTGADALERVLENIELAVHAGLRVKINAVLMRGINDGEWLGLSRLAQRLPVDVRFIELMPIGCAGAYEPVSNEDLLAQFARVYPGLKADTSVHGNGPAVYYRIPGAPGSIGFISAIHGKFCADCNRLRLTSMGKLKPCLCFADEVDVMEIVRSGAADTHMRLGRAFARAVKCKPPGHRFESRAETTERKQMVQIGG